MKPKVVKLWEWNPSRLDNVLTEAEQGALERYSTKARRNAEIMALAHRCMAQDPEPLVHPLTGRRARCCDSYNYKETYNAVGFDDGTEPVFVIQRLSSLDAFYLPKRNLLFTFRLQDAHIKELFDHVDLTKRNVKAQREFAGFILSHHRPYHFFYDAMPVLADIDATWEGERSAKTSTDLVQLQGGDYLPVNMIYPDYPSYTSTSAYLNHSTRLRNRYYLKLGYSGVEEETHQEAVARFDDYIRRSPLAAGADETPKVGPDAVTVAFDISNEKGTWRSIRNDVPAIVERISAELGTEVHVVLDGWTMPYTPRARDQQRVREEKRRMGSIRRRLRGIAARVDSLIGASPRDKIERLQHVDAFVARYGTGSMFVSRILHRPGIAHHSGMANYEDIHLQGPDVTTVRGVPKHQDPDTNPNSIPYDLDWEQLTEELLSILRRRERAD